MVYIKKHFLIGFLILIMSITFGCNKNGNSNSNSISSKKIPLSSFSSKNENNTDVELSLNDVVKANPISECRYVQSVTPNEGATVDSESNITIEFNCEMDPSTLNPKNIIIMEYKHSKTISDLFNYNYDIKTKVLHINF